MMCGAGEQRPAVLRRCRRPWCGAAPAFRGEKEKKTPRRPHLGLDSHGVAASHRAQPARGPGGASVQSMAKHAVGGPPVFWWSARPPSRAARPADAGRRRARPACCVFAANPALWLTRPVLDAPLVDAPRFDAHGPSPTRRARSVLGSDVARAAQEPNSGPGLIPALTMACSRSSVLPGVPPGAAHPVVHFDRRRTFGR